MLFGFVGSGSTDQRRMYIVPVGARAAAAKIAAVQVQVVDPAVGVLRQRARRRRRRARAAPVPDGVGQPACVPTFVVSVL